MLVTASVLVPLAAPRPSADAAALAIAAARIVGRCSLLLPRRLLASLRKILAEVCRSLDWCTVPGQVAVLLECRE